MALSNLRTACGLLLTAAVLGRGLSGAPSPWQPRVEYPTHYNARSGLDHGIPRKRKKGRS